MLFSRHGCCFLHCLIWVSYLGTYQQILGKNHLLQFCPSREIRLAAVLVLHLEASENEKAGVLMAAAPQKSRLISKGSVYCLFYEHGFYRIR